jgi:hypothetical protein
LKFSPISSAAAKHLLQFGTVQPHELRAAEKDHENLTAACDQIQKGEVGQSSV